MNDLSVLYQEPQKTSFLHSRYFVEGCLLGACACPEIPLPDVWLPWVIKHHHQIQNAQQADKITDALFKYFKLCLAQMHNQTLQVPDYLVYKHEDHEALKQWCEGLLFAHNAQQKCWQGAWDKMQQQAPDRAPKLAKNLKHCLVVFSTFADPANAIENAIKNDDFGLVDKLPIIAKSLQQTLLTYVAISGELAGFLPNQFETFQKE